MTDGPQNVFTDEQLAEIKDLIKGARKNFVDFSEMETEEERESYHKTIDQLSR